MKKLVISISILIIAPITAAVYGILHDQITYTISSEYYTAFKFIQFGFNPAYVTYAHDSPRLLVSLVGIMATWWVGIPIGVILMLAGLIHKKPSDMFVITMRSIAITIVVTFIVGLIGLLYGAYYLSGTTVDWWIPENVTNKDSFVAVGSMHNFSYFGGIIGAVCGVIYSIRKRKHE